MGYHRNARRVGIACYTEPLDLPLKGYGTVKAVIFEEPDDIMIELMSLPSATEVLVYRQQRGK